MVDAGRVVVVVREAKEERSQGRVVVAEDTVAGGVGRTPRS